MHINKQYVERKIDRYIYIYIYRHMCKYIYIYICKHICIICAYICVYICIYIYIYICIHTHILVSATIIINNVITTHYYEYYDYGYDNYDACMRMRMLSERCLSMVWISIWHSCCFFDPAGCFHRMIMLRSLAWQCLRDRRVPLLSTSCHRPLAPPLMSSSLQVTARTFHSWAMRI